MKTVKLLKTVIPVILLFTATLFIGSSCAEPLPEPPCNEVSYKVDGNAVVFDESLVTAEIFNDAAIGKFYDIWTDESVSGHNGFYYHSTITENNETAPYTSDWFTTNDIGNLVFLNAAASVNVTFTIVEGANAVGDNVHITFSGTYDDISGITHTITDGEICTSIDVVH